MDASVIIWTTTPWTLPANTGISLNGEEEYVLTSDNFIVAKKLYNSLIADEVIKGEIVKDINPNDLENTFAINPVNGKQSKIVLGDHVMMDAGTGAVHTAPGHGEDDYKIGLKYGLDVVMPVGANGAYDNTIVRENLLPNPEEFLNMNVFKANEPILELLGDALLKRVDINHSYPHCWRTHKPVIFRATKQWFIAMDQPYGKDGKTLRQNGLDAIESVEFFPAHGKNRLKTMIEGRPDWCISRQRDWGVPIAFFRNKLTDEIVYDEQVLNYVAMIFEMKGADAWYDLEIKDLLYPGCGLNPDDLEKTMDILDVWFDSGSTQNAVLRSRNYDAGTYPADMYLEGSDQHRGWFQSSLLTSLASSEIAPYKSILTHGFTVDAKGEKMSKSKGNVIAPNKVLKQYGGEILRMWVAMSDYQSDLKISDGILKQMAEQYRKIRNTGKILLGNVHELEEICPLDKMATMDLWILDKAQKLFLEVDESFKENDYSRGLNRLNHFIVAELSNIYIDICKDKMYCDAKNSETRIASQSAMAMIAKAFLTTLAPILTYTMNELVQHAPKVITNGVESIFDMPKYVIPEITKEMLDINEEHLLNAKSKFSEIKDKLNKEKVIKSTLELVIYTNSEDVLALDSTVAEDWFVVSKVMKSSEDGAIGSFEVDGKLFEVYHGSKSKCPRCWKFRAKDENSLCSRCNEVVN